MKRHISVRSCCSAEGFHNGACWSVPDIGVFSRFVDHRGLRAEFPVLERLAYLNAGTDGPLPARAVAAARAELERQAQEGRHHDHLERRKQLTGEPRKAYATPVAGGA